MGDWRWFDDLKAKWTGEDLASEADRSLSRDSSRWPTRHVPDVIDEEQPITRHDRAAGAGRPRRGGKGGQTERHSWDDEEYRKARQDLQRQAADYAREQQRDQDEAQRALRDIARERREAAREVREAQRAARDNDRQGRPPPGYRS
jgi:hypothetical protein